MVSDQEIASCVEAVLRSPQTAAAATANDVVNQVEAKLGVELSHKAAFIRDQIALIRGQSPPATAAVQLPGNPQLMYSFYQFPPGSYPFAFRFPPPGAAPVAVQGGAGGGGVLLPQLPQQQLQQAQTASVQKPLPGAGSRTSIHLQKKTFGLKTGAPARIKRKRGPGGLTRLCGVSPVLQTIVGESVMPRTQIVKQLWAYIRKNNLQDPNNKRNIVCNDELRMVLETDFTDIFKMNKQLAKHITPLEPSKDVGQDSKKLKVDNVAETEPVTGSDPCPMFLSDALTEFLGTGEKELLQSEVVSRISDYIQDNLLEDAVNSMIMCDPKLQQLFGCESVATSALSESFGSQNVPAVHTVFFMQRVKDISQKQLGFAIVGGGYNEALFHGIMMNCIYVSR